MENLSLMDNYVINTPRMKSVIIMGGSGGSGRSTCAKQLGEITGLKNISGGFRKLAMELGFGKYDLHTNQRILLESELVEFQNQYAPLHPEVDLKLDADLFVEAQRGNVIIESTTLGPISKRLNLQFIRVWIDASEEERINRIIKRELTKNNIVTGKEVKAILGKRIEDNQKRYLALYGFDYTDIDAYYEFNFDTTEIEESAMGSILLEKLIENEFWTNVG